MSASKSEKVHNSQEDKLLTKALSIEKKIINWIKDPQNMLFLAIVIVSIAIRLYYFSLTKNQALWWDEADYLAYAKNIAGYNVDWVVTAKHNSLYPFLAAWIFKVGFSEIAAKFILQFIPSVLTILLVYYVAVEMYGDKKIGLVCAAILSTFWLHLFNTMRFHIDIPALFFGMLAIYVFWRGHENNRKIFGRIHPKWSIPLTVVFVIITYAIRRGYFLFGLFIFVYILLSKKWAVLLKNKMNWIGAGVAAVLLLFVEKTIFSSSVSAVSQGYYKGDNAINFFPLDVFASFFSNPPGIWPNVFFFFFLAGIVIMGVSVIFSFSSIKNQKSSKVPRADLFNLICIIVTLAFFILIFRIPDRFGDPRWYLPLAFACFIAIGRSSTLLYNLIKRYGKYLAAAVIIILISVSGFYQYQQSDGTILGRVDSFKGIKEAGLLLREISDPDDLIVVQPQPQTAYYAERSVQKPLTFTGFNGSDANNPFPLFLQRLREVPNARYVLVSFSEPNHPIWMKQQGQTVWSIPFMNTTINLGSQQHQILQEVTYEDITFRIVDIKQDVFIYEVIRS